MLLSVRRGAWSGGPAATVDLEALSVDDVRQLVEGRVGAPVPFRIAEALQIRTAGTVAAVVAAVVVVGGVAGVVARGRGRRR